MKKMDNKGFSLVELIVVIAIMAVLMGVLAPTLLGNVEKSKLRKDQSATDTLYTAFQEIAGEPECSAAVIGEKFTFTISSAGKLTIADASFTAGDTNENAKAAELLEEYVGAKTITYSSKTFKKGGTVTVAVTMKGKVAIQAVDCNGKTDGSSGSNTFWIGVNNASEFNAFLTNSTTETTTT
jgi:type IV pilus assembly protein PilA